MKVLEKVFPSNSKALPVILMAIIIMFSACNPGTDDSSKANSDSSNSSLRSQEETSTKSLFEPDFRILYINNFPDSNELQKLLERPKKGTVDKVVLQFLHDSLGNLTLAAFAGRQNHKGFKNHVQILHTSDEKPEVPISFDGTNICFSSQEISKKGRSSDGRLKDLEALINKPGYEYIAFTPKDTVYSEKNPNRKYIIYKLGFWSKQTFIGKGTPTPLNMVANPCPPWDVY